MKKLICIIGVIAGAASASADKTEEIIQGYSSRLNTLQKEQIPSQQMFVCLNDEKNIRQIEDAVIIPLKDAILKKDFSALKTANFDQILNFKQNKKPFRTIEGVQEFSWAADGKGSFAEHLKNFSSIDYVYAKITDYKINPQARDDKKNFNKVTLIVSFDIRGNDQKNLRLQDKYQLTIDSEKNKNDWSILTARLDSGKTLVQTRKPVFEDITESSGLNKVAVTRRTEAIRRGGYALSVIDYNSDGIPDLFIGHRDNAQVFLGDKNGHFSIIPTPFDKEKYTKTAVFADFENRGKQDAVINRFIAVNSDGSQKVNERLPAQVAFYKSTDKGFIEQENKFGTADIFKSPMPSAVGDFNDDGLLDIYIGYPGVQDFSQLSDPAPSAKKFQGLYLNDGKGGFIDSTERLDYSFEKFQARLFPHSALAVDLNQDQKLDLVVLDDRGNLSPTFLNQGNGRFKESAEKIGVVEYNFAMGISSGDINNDGLVDIGMTSVNFPEMNRMNKACARHVSGSLFKNDPGLRLFTSANSAEKKEFKFNEVSEDKFDDIGEGAGGLTFIDYNNDGLLDIYVVNGLWSGSPKGQDMGSFFVSALRSTQHVALYSLNSRNDLRFMDLLSEFQGRVGDYSDVKSISKGADRPSLAGYQRNRLLRNNGDGTFTDVGFMEGVDSIADGYIVGKIDYNHDGVPDLVLRNADPGTDDYKFPSVQLFKNNSAPKKSVILTFRGTNRSKEGIGLFVKAHAKKWQQVEHLEGNSGSMQQQRFVHFGLGKNKKLDYVEVFWPSGVKQLIKNVTPGYHEIVEPLTTTQTVSSLGN